MAINIRIYINFNIMMPNKVADFFAILALPLVYASDGVRMDYAKNVSAEVDANLYAEVLLTLFVYDSPLTCLETTLAITGAAQQLVLTSPTVGDANVADETRVVGVDVAIQLNSFTLPVTPFAFNIFFVDATATAPYTATGVGTLQSRTQTLEGTASVNKGDTRQFIRALCFEQNSTMTSAGVTSVLDGKLVSLPRFRQPAPGLVAGAAATLGLTLAQIRTLFSSFATDVAAIVIDIPAGVWTPGISVTASPITIGRLDTVTEVIRSLDAIGSAAQAPVIDKGNASLFTFLKGIANPGQ
jgi:hypothetical protein